MVSSPRHLSLAVLGLWVPWALGLGACPVSPVLCITVIALTTFSGALLMVSVSRAVSTEGLGLPQSSPVSPSAASGLSGLLPCRMLRSLTRSLSASKCWPWCKVFATCAFASGFHSICCSFGVPEHFPGC